MQDVEIIFPGRGWQQFLDLEGPSGGVAEAIIRNGEHWHLFPVLVHRAPAFWTRVVSSFCGNGSSWDRAILWAMLTLLVWKRPASTTVASSNRQTGFYDASTTTSSLLSMPMPNACTGQLRLMGLPRFAATAGWVLHSSALLPGPWLWTMRCHSGKPVAIASECLDMRLQMSWTLQSVRIRSRCGNWLETQIRHLRHIQSCESASLRDSVPFDAEI